MAGTPVKLTFDLSYPDHAQAYEILRAQKHTTQFVVNLILGSEAVSCGVVQGSENNATGTRQVTKVTDKIPISNPQDTRQKVGTTLEDIPKALLGFIEED